VISNVNMISDEFDL